MCLCVCVCVCVCASIEIPGNQSGFIQQIQTVLMFPEYGMSDIKSFAGDWLVLVGFCLLVWLVSRSVGRSFYWIIILLFRKPVDGNSFVLIFRRVFCKLEL